MRSELILSLLLILGCSDSDNPEPEPPAPCDECILEQCPVTVTDCQLASGCQSELTCAVEACEGIPAVWDDAAACLDECNAGSEAMDLGRCAWRHCRLCTQ